MKKYFISGFLILAFALVSVFKASSSQAVGKPADLPSVTAAAADGLVQVDGQPVIVSVWVAVLPGEDAHAKAQAVLHRAYPDARPFNKADYTTNGLVWDQFFDNNSGNDQVDVNYNDQGMPSYLLNSRQTLDTAMDTWTQVASSTFAYHDHGTTTRCPSLVKECPGRQYFDGNNDIGWLNIKDPSVLGVTWYGTQTDEFDMVLDNQNFTWYIGDPNGISDGQYDAQTVWLHELGHGLGLGHSDDPNAVMYAYYQGVRRDLRQDDVNGITALYPADGQPAPTDTPTPTPTTTSTPTLTPTPTPTPASGNPTPTPCWPPGKCKHNK